MTEAEFQMVNDLPVTARVQVAYDCYADGRVHYQGFAVSGTAQSSAGWYIIRYTYDASNNPLTQQNSPFGAVFANRDISVTYG